MFRLYILVCFILLAVASFLYAATKEEVLQAIAQEKAQVQAALASTTTEELKCDTQYWAHNMITVRYENGVWYYKCGNPCLANGIVATNVYYCPS